MIKTTVCLGLAAAGILSACVSVSGSVTGATTPAVNGARAQPAPAAPAPPFPAGGVPPGWKLVWSDEFDMDGLPDEKKWRYDTDLNATGWHNRELQYYSHARLENARVADGKLTITALKERLTAAADYGGQSYTSARLLTRGKANWTYGFFDIRAKLPCGAGTWPAIWTLGENGTWPMLGEIDIMEHVGKKKGEILGTVHTAAFNHTINTQQGATVQIADVCDAFHNYQLKWDADQIAVGVDGKYFFQFLNPKDGDLTKWPFSAPQHLLLNIAIGGELGGPVDNNIFPVKMEVDYVRIYQP